MNNHRLVSQSLKSWPALVLLLLFQVSGAFGQVPLEVEQMGFADTVFINGKIVSMDDLSKSANVGNIYQAIAVKGDKIMKLDSNQEVQAMAGRITTVFDLHGPNHDPRYY